MYASAWGHPTCVAFLLERGADPTITDDHFKSALSHCKTDEIRKLLEDATNATNYVLK